jgi:N-acetylneuraminic acid mutarotase
VYTPRTGHTTVCYEDRIFLFGGSDNENILNDLYSLNLTEKTWKNLSLNNNKGPIPHPRSGSKSVIIDTSIYFFGGYT